MIAGGRWLQVPPAAGNIRVVLFFFHYFCCLDRLSAWQSFVYDLVLVIILLGCFRDTALSALL